MGTNAFNGLVFLTSTMPEFGLHQLGQTADLDAGITRRSTCSATSCCTLYNNRLIYIQGRSSGSDEAPRAGLRAVEKGMSKQPHRTMGAG
ncbi:hypothetical protein pRL120512 [Rhizobium johnstonii 3841]|uniref:Uncharacterized protein n=1 Tax=Rhizobium johnstonii (strain DSM 114642 / LMG 32736 / 3841) TaxID=216596 RepID=Q1M3V3_RHIJ3|nr:hypothetical protein pRL120512 [Rhizobium johnstonii 3841]